MVAVLGMAVAVVDVVDVVTVGDRLVSTIWAVLVIGVVVMYNVLTRRALVPVVSMLAMRVAVVDVVDVIAVRDRLVSTVRAVDVWVLFVLSACGCHVGFLLFARGRVSRSRCD